MIEVITPKNFDIWAYVDWLHENVTYREWAWEYGSLYDRPVLKFKHEDDRLAFKLKFGL